MNTLKYARIGLALLALAGVGGCAEKAAEMDVTGKVTIDGQPIETGTISFIAADGAAPTGGGVIKDGVYTAKVPPGKKTVLVLGNKLVGKEPLYKDVPDSPMRDKYQMVTPEAYNAAHLTPLKASITDSQQGLDFELTSKLEPKK